jgi:hypothetical protein
LYADDVVLLAENETELQLLLDVLNSWCCKNELEVNYDKSNILHFRNQSRIVTSNDFHIGDNTIEIVTQYNYLGLVITEFLDYNIMAKAVAMSASRTLGLLIAKCKFNGDFIFNTYTTVYDSLVWSIISYGAAIWGTKDYSCINAVQNRAMRFYLGVGKYTPNLSVIGDMGWKPSIIRQWPCVLRNWQKCTRMDSTQLNKKVFLWANRCATSRVKTGNLECQITLEIRIWIFIYKIVGMQ